MQIAAHASVLCQTLEPHGTSVLARRELILRRCRFGQSHCPAQNPKQVYSLPKCCMGFLLAQTHESQNCLVFSVMNSPCSQCSAPVEPPDTCHAQHALPRAVSQVFQCPEHPITGEKALGFKSTLLLYCYFSSTLLCLPSVYIVCSIAFLSSEFSNLRRFTSS